MEERYGRAAIASIAIHGMVALLILFGGYLLPSAAIQIGGGIGGGTGGPITTVGVVDEFSGGAGMVKRGLVPRPPALVDKPRQDKSKAIPLPGTLEPKKQKLSAEDLANARKAAAKSNRVPTEAEPGSGGAGGASGGSGGGFGGGIGVSIGSGTGSSGNSWYAQTVADRISRNWQCCSQGARVEMTYSFYIRADGYIYGVKLEQSSGNSQMDLTGERAIRDSSPLSAPPAEFRGRPVKFVANFAYHLNP